MRHTRLAAYTLLFILGLYTIPFQAKNASLNLPAIYTSYMVIQQHKPFLLHGTANAGCKVTAQLGEEQQDAIVSENGYWQVTFKPLEATHIPLTLTVTDGDTTLTLTDLLVGEVWLCSGQSNMAFMLHQDKQGKEHMNEASTKNLRLYDMRPRVYTDAVAWDSTSLAALNHLDYFIPTQWQPITEHTAAQFSAIAYYFGAMLCDSLDVPIGLICNAVGGAPIESFTDRQTQKHHPILANILTDWRHNDLIQPWVRSRAAQNIRLSHKAEQRHPYEPCYLYEAGIAPLAGFPMRGVIWYQGESNAHNVELFEFQFPALVSSWRHAWNDDTLPFHFVQLSSIARPTWPHFRDVQRRLGLQIPHCEMAVSSDHGDSLDVHPRHKRPIGERLARIALHYNYGYGHVEPSGPSILKAENKGNSIVLTFNHAEGMTTSDGSTPRTFEVAGDHGEYYPADIITIKDSTIHLQSKQVKCPTRARYGWQPFTRANLINSHGLPTSTFEITTENSY